ncbi:MAG TPA: NAD(P)-dependent alcohol dehydrogenase [Cyclobacteriaceae bacterium]
MKAIICPKYGSPDILELKEIAKPIPRDNEILIKIYASSLNAADWHIMRGDPAIYRPVLGLLKPKYRILGADVAGQVEQVGKSVTRFKQGDEVFGNLFACGLGGFAEFVCAVEDALVLKPANIKFEEAAAVPLAAISALQGLRAGQIRSGQKILINGASGGVGTFAVQIAKSFGAEVTAVCSTGKIEMVRSIGADHVIDYTKEDFTRNDKHFDLIVAANGDRSILDYKRALAPTGRYVMIGGSGSQMAQAIFIGPFISMISGKKMSNLVATSNQKDLVFMMELLEAGTVKPVIDRRYTLSQVPDAMRYLEEGHAMGKIVINMES